MTATTPPHPAGREPADPQVIQREERIRQQTRRFAPLLALLAGFVTGRCAQGG